MKELIAVIRRELIRMFARPLYIFGSVIVMTFCCIFYLTILDEGLPERLPIGIVDYDQSSISRMMRREIDAGQSVEIISEYANYTDAREAMQRGEIYAFIVIPENLYSDLLAFHRPTVTLYANSAYTLGGTLAYKQLLTMTNLASGAVQREVMRGRGYKDEQIMPLVQPVVIDTHILGNPWVNYAVYIGSTVLPGTLGLMVLLLSAFSITHELKKRTAQSWLNTAGGSMITALFGKMIPYTVLFTVIGWGMNVLMYKILHFPMEGSFWFMGVAIFAFILAMQSMAILIVSFLPMPGLAISLCALYGTLSFTLSGFSYPIDAMLPPFQALSWLIPLRHYYIISVDQSLMGLPVAKSCFRLAILLATALLPFLLTKRLKNAISDPDFIIGG